MRKVGGIGNKRERSSHVYGGERMGGKEGGRRDGGRDEKAVVAAHNYRALAVCQDCTACLTGLSAFNCRLG